MKKVTGLDSLRFILAAIVVLGHSTLYTLDIFHTSSTNRTIALTLINGILGNIFPGQAAVIAFFIISGFCIHYPHATGKHLNIGEFYIKRLIRIGIPSLLAFIIYSATLHLQMGVIWSLVCEIIYYLLYPLILKYKGRYFNVMLISSFILSYLVTINYSLFSQDYDGNFHRDGFLVTWLVGLPVWLLGVDLASKFSDPINNYTPSFLRLVILRLLTWAAAIATSIMRFHLNISHAYTLPVFALLAYVWIKAEIQYYADKKENKFLEYGGIISFSVYLVHAYVLYVIALIFDGTHVSKWLVAVLSLLPVLPVSWLFYIMVERHSHKLAKSIKLRRIFKPAFYK